MSLIKLISLLGRVPGPWINAKIGFCSKSSPRKLNFKLVSVLGGVTGPSISLEVGFCPRRNPWAPTIL